MRSLMIGMAALIATGAHGETVQQMLSFCRPIANASAGNEPETLQIPMTFETGTCWGAFSVLQEVSRGARDPSRSAQARLFGFCPPAEATRTQYVGIFVRFAAQYPARWNEDFVPVATQALQAAFPCR
jgi:hypothetical protein